MRPPTRGSLAALIRQTMGASAANTFRTSSTIRTKTTLKPRRRKQSTDGGEGCGKPDHT